MSFSEVFVRVHPVHVEGTDVETDGAVEFLYRPARGRAPLYSPTATGRPGDHARQLVGRLGG